MYKFFKILYFFSLFIIFPCTSFAQNNLRSIQDQKKVIINKQYGFKLDYQGRIIQKTNSEYLIQINKSNPQDLIYMKVDSRLSVYLPGTYGGWLYYNDKKSTQTQSGIVSTKKNTVNGMVFTRDYWLVYGGEGSWDAIINSYTKYKDKFYIFSLVHNFLEGMPGIIINNKKSTKQEFIIQGLKRMKNKGNVYVRKYNEMLSSFSFSNISQ